MGRGISDFMPLGARSVAGIFIDYKTIFTEEECVQVFGSFKPHGPGSTDSTQAQVVKILHRYPKEQFFNDGQMDVDEIRRVLKEEVKKEREIIEGWKRLAEDMNNNPDNYFKMSPEVKALFEKADAAERASQAMGFCLCTRWCKNFGKGPCIRE